MPFGGTIADFASEQLGRPLSVGLGNEVFGGDTTTDPITGQTTPGNTTHTGGSVTVQGVGQGIRNHRAARGREHGTGGALEGGLTGKEKLPVKITLTLGQTSLQLVVDGEIELE